MTTPGLPRAVVALLEWLVPSRGRAEVVGDLAEEYRAVTHRLGPLRATAWLCGQVASLITAWARQLGRTLLRSRSVLWRDSQMALRSLRRRPLAAIGAAAMLGVGLVAVALSTALQHALIDRPVSALRGAAVRRVIAIERSGREQARFSLPELERIASHAGGAATISAVALEPALAHAGVARRQTLAEIVTAHHAEVIGMDVRVGRPLMAADFVERAPPAALISDTLWQALFNRSSAVLGTALNVNGRPFSVVGVARIGSPTSFWGASVDLWIPVGRGDAFFGPGWRTNAAARPFTLFALPSAPAPDLTARLDRAAASLAAEFPGDWRDRTLGLTPATALLGSQRDAAGLLSRVLLGLAWLILVVAAANLGTMMVAGAVAGRRALAIHVAIGAGPGAAPRRLLIEGALVGAAASLLAAALYAIARQRIAEVALLPTLSLRLDLPATSTTFGVLVPAGLLAGLTMAAAPAAWIARHAAGMHALIGGRRGVTDGGMAGVRRAIVGAQLALCLVLLVGATLFARSLDRVTHADLGIERDRLAAFDFDIEPDAAGGRPPDAIAAEALRRVQSMPGIAAAAMASRAPVDTSTPTVRLSSAGAEALTLEVTFNTVTADYFATVGVPLLRGRGFREADAEGVAIVNEALARHLWPGADALDRALTLDTGVTVQVVGVARDATYRAIGESHRPHLYLPTLPAFGRALLVRTKGDPRRALAEVQNVLDEVGPGVVGFFPRTLDDHLAVQLLPLRAVASVSAWLGVLALGFCAVALYGVVAWFAMLRQPEMAVRLALGATRFEIERLVIGHAVAVAAPGVLGGVVLAGAGAIAARGLLFGLGTPDLAAAAAGIGVLMAVVVAASWKPARAAARTDPATMLRSQ